MDYTFLGMDVTITDDKHKSGNEGISVTLDAPKNVCIANEQCEKLTGKKR